MTYRAIWLLAGGLLVIGLVWVAAQVERIEVREQGVFGDQARTNRYLAAMRFLEEVGLETNTALTLEDLFPLGATGQTIMIPGTRIDMSRRRQEELLGWVEIGGHLMVRAAPPAWFEESSEVRLDPLLEPAGIAVQDTDWDGESSREMRVEDLIIEANVPYHELIWSGVDPDLVLKVDGHPAVVSVPFGAGRMTVLLTFWPFENRSLGERDNAAALWRLSTLHGVNPVTVVLSEAMPGLLTWLWAYYSAVVAALAALLILWLWRATPRFGPPLPDPPSRTRSLRAHLAAAGRYCWQSHQAATELQGKRRRLWNQLRRRYRLPADPGPDALDLAAQRLGISGAVVRQALHLPVTTGASLLEALHQIRRLERNLDHGPATRRSSAF